METWKRNFNCEHSIHLWTQPCSLCNAPFEFKMKHGNVEMKYREALKQGWLNFSLGGVPFEKDKDVCVSLLLFYIQGVYQKPFWNQFYFPFYLTRGLELLIYITNEERHIRSFRANRKYISRKMKSNNNVIFFAVPRKWPRGSQFTGTFQGTQVQKLQRHPNSKGNENVSYVKRTKRGRRGKIKGLLCIEKKFREIQSFNRFEEGQGKVKE